MNVAQGPGFGLRERTREHGPPGVLILRPRAGGELQARDMRRVPFDQQVGLDQQGFEIVGRNAIGSARISDVARQIARMQLREQQHGFPVSLGDRAVASGDSLRAEIFEHGEPDLEIGGEQARRGKALRDQGFVHGDEGPDVFREMNQRAVGLAVAHGRAVRAAAAKSSARPCRRRP